MRVQDNEGENIETKRIKQAIWEAARKAGIINISRRGKDTKVWFNGQCKEQRIKVWQRLKTITGNTIESFEKKCQKITGNRTIEEW